MGAMQLYRASDALMAHREAIERHLFDQAMGLFDLHPTVTLYDLTNTFFEGQAARQPMAQRGHSKDKRTDCPLLTLALVLDSSGFVRRSQVFAGNVREHHTVAEMLEALNAPREALVVMDRGIATEDRVQWLRDNGYRYLVVSRERIRQFDPDAAQRIDTAQRQGVHLHKVVSEDGHEARLYCFSEERAAKERGIVERFARQFRDRPDRTVRRIVSTAHPQTRRPGLGTYRSAQGEKPTRRPALRHRTRHRPQRRARHRGALLPPPGRSLDDDPSGGVLPAQQSNRLGRGNPVANLCHPHRPRGRLPLTEIGTRTATHLPPQAHPAPKDICSSPSSPTSSYSSSDDVCAKPATTRAGTPFDESSKDNSASPPPSDAPMGAPCMYAKPPALNRPSRPSTTPLGIDPAPGATRKTIV